MIADNDPDARIPVMPADHVILDRKLFLDAVQVAALAARDASIVTFGITPSSPETDSRFARGLALRERCH